MAHNTIWLQTLDFVSFNPDTGAYFEVSQTGRNDEEKSHTLFYNRPGTSGRITLYIGDEPGCDLVLAAINRTFSPMPIAELVKEQIEIEAKKAEEAKSGE